MVSVSSLMILSNISGACSGSQCTARSCSGTTQVSPSSPLTRVIAVAHIELRTGPMPSPNLKKSGIALLSLQYRTGLITVHGESTS